jgi:hypothetical protein
VVAPGLLVVKHNRGEDAGKFVNVAVLEADRVKIVDQEAAAVPDCPELLTSLLGFDSHGHGESMNVLIELAVSMREHRRGGLLAVTPSGSMNGVSGWCSRSRTRWCRRSRRWRS